MTTMKYSSSTKFFYFLVAAAAFFAASNNNNNNNNNGVVMMMKFSVTAFTVNIVHNYSCSRRTKRTSTTTTLLHYKPESTDTNDQQQQQQQLKQTIPSYITSPALQQVGPQLLQWKELYGHPNIPLKNPGGNLCLTIRRLRIQNKLTEKEIEWLSSIGFVFHSMEDVYKYATFDEMFQRLVSYEQNAKPENKSYQIPKKCPEDPELGAWVTGIRRLGKDGVNPEHERRLDEIGFTWISTRACGSKFMMKYRELSEEVEKYGLDHVMRDPETIPWIVAQQETLKRGGLSQTRVHYMGSLFGDTWTTIGKEK
jgi:hypothetical protein